MTDTTGIDIDGLAKTTTLKHAVTRFRIELTCYAANAVGGRLKRGCELKWVAAKDLPDAPLSVTGRKLADWTIKAM